MLPLRLGHFPQFNGSDTVLLAGTSDAIVELSCVLSRFVESGSPELELLSLAAPSPQHTAKLLATRALTAAILGAFAWQCNAETLPSIQACLRSLSAAGGGHQYFNLLPNSAQLMVSINEYPEAWWAEHG